MDKIIDDSDPSIKGFDRLSEDELYVSEMEVERQEILSSDIAKH